MMAVAAAEQTVPRPWRCSRRTAVYCPLCHDCMCVSGRADGCPLHGVMTAHGGRVEMVR